VPAPAPRSAPSIRAVGADGSDPGPVPGSPVWWAEHEARLARRRPRAAGLTLERILDEALAVVDADGLDALTVRCLAERLSTGSSSLYRHVASRDELLVLLIDRVLGDVPLPSPSADPRRAVEQLSLDLRRVLLAHPNVVPALRTTPLGGPQVRRASEAGLSQLLRVGYPPDVAVQGFLALLDYVLGSVLFDSAAGARSSRPDDLDAAVEPGPLTVPLVEAWLGADSDRVFAFGLARFLDGLDALVGQAHASNDR
jgi:AcrR family transcriptional regulator